MSTKPIPVIDSHSLLVLLLSLGLLLGLSLMLGSLGRRIGLPTLVGELATGVVLGPSLLGNAAPGLFRWLQLQNANQLHLLDAVGEVGVLLLTAVIGIHVDLGTIRANSAAVTRISLAGLLLPLAMGAGVGFLAPASVIAGHTHRNVFAFFIGVAICISAIPVIAKTLLDLGLMHRDVGQLIMSGAAVTDCVGWVLLSVVSTLATVGVRAGHIGLSIGCLLGLLLLTWLAGRPVAVRVMRMAERSEQRSMPITAVVVMVALSSAATQAMGFEAVLGAFLCGVVIGQVPGIDLARLAPLNTFTTAVLAPIFFATVGLRMDITALRNVPLLLTGLAVLAVAIVGKFAGAYAGARMSRLTHWEGLAIGAGLNSRGVVEVVMALVGLRLGILDVGMYTVIVVTAVATSMLAPPLLRIAASHIAPTPDEFVRRELMQALEGGAPLPRLRDGRIPLAVDVSRRPGSRFTRGGTVRWPRPRG